MKSGFFITIEGIDGSGKSTILKYLTEVYANDPRFTGLVTTREPGGTTIAETIRNLIFQDIDAETEMLLFAAARTEHLHRKLLPNLAEGKLIISDRYIDSSYVYQGKTFPVQLIQEMNQFAIQQCMPDLTIVLMIPATVSQERLSKNEREMNRLDCKPLAFYEDLYERYASLPKMFPERKIILVDVNCSIEEACQRVQQVCETAFAQRG